MNGRVLTQAEIDALLPSSREPSGKPVSGGAVPYDFSRPDRITKDELRSLHLLHDRFALNVSTTLSAYLRAVTEVTVVSVEQFLYSEFLMSLPDATAFYAVDVDPARATGALEISPVVAFTVIDRMLGGSGAGVAPNRALTEIELNVIDAITKVLLKNLTDTWRPLSKMQLRVTGRETRPQMLQVADANEVMILLVFDVRVGENRGAMHICFPAAALEPIVQAMASGNQRARELNTQADQWLQKNLSRVPLEVSAQLETTLPARDLVLLAPGQILELPHVAGRHVDVHVGGRTRFQGRLTIQSNSMAGVVVEQVAYRADKVSLTLAEAA